MSSYVEKRPNSGLQRLLAATQRGLGMRVAEPASTPAEPAPEPEARPAPEAKAPSQDPL